ncbi:hypothetical protein JCM8097_003572 [Rhodosporidiobolus ruineniae]
MSCLATPLRFLPLSLRELNLAASCKSGQSFRWHRLAPPVATLPDAHAGSVGPSGTLPDEAEEWAFPWQDRTVVCRQDDTGLYYRSLYPFAPPHTAFLADLSSNTTEQFLRRYFQLDIPLAPLYDQWSAKDVKFKRKVELGGEGLQGIRVLAQDEFETLVSFICSANNNISRITLMVNRLCASRGSPLPHPSHFTPSAVHSSASSIPSSAPPPPNDLSLFSFPAPSALTAPSTEPLLRQLGFGYRASFIPSSAAHLVASAAEAGQTPEEYLRALRREEFVKAGRGGIKEAREKLVEFKGVGRKVADCVLLFGLGWSETVPVDTHVFQIAIRDYAFPATRTTALTPALHDRVATHLASAWGTAHAGWAQQVLFLSKVNEAGSPSKKAPVGVFSKIEYEETEEMRFKGQGEDGERREVKRKMTFEEEVAALIAAPAGTKRARRSVTKVKVEVEVEVDEVGASGSGSELSELEESEEEEEKPKRRKGAKKGGRKKALKAE